MQIGGEIVILVHVITVIVISIEVLGDYQMSH